MILSVFFLITSSKFQTSFANRIAQEINDEYGTEIAINKASLSLNGNVDLNDFLIKDHKNDTLVYFKNLYLSPISLGKLVSNDLNFNSVSFDGLDLRVSNYKGDKLNSLQIFLEKLKIDKDFPINEFDKSSFASKVFSKNSKIEFIDYQNQSKSIKISNINFLINDLSFYNSDFDFKIEDLNFKYGTNTIIDDLSGNFMKKDSVINFSNSKIIFGESIINGDLNLDYSDIKSSNLASKDFLNSLQFDVLINDSQIVSTDIGQLFSSFETNYKETWMIKSEISGYLNDLEIRKWFLSNKKNNIELNCKITNILDEDYSVIFDILEFNVDSKEINKAFPNFFGSILPSSLRSFGRFNIDGLISVNPDDVKSKFNFQTKQGLLISDLNIFDFKNIDNASYIGEIKGLDLDLSSFLNVNYITKSDFNFKVEGKGFTKEYLNSSLTGSIENVELYNYKLENIDLSGDVKDQIFDGNLKVDDKNISLFFNGLVDFSDDLVDFDFDLDLLKADLNNINDEYDNSISGSANVKLRGSRIENLIGDLSINNLKFSNSDINTTFEKFDAQLRYNDDIRIVNLNSSDAVSGIIIGEYDVFSLKNILLNSVGSHYSNYKLDDNIDFQNISFNINIKPKLAYLINSKLDLDESTFVSGNFKSDGDYELGVKSNYINYDNIETENIDLKFSNNGGEFKIKKLKSSLVEGTNFYVDSTFSDDTLYVNSNYKTFSNNQNKLNFYHTINEKNNSVFGFINLDLILNKKNWSLSKNSEPKLIINNNLQSFSANNISFINENQEIKLDISNSENGSNYNLIFNEVKLNSFTRKSSSIIFDGVLDGDVSFSKIDEVYSGDSSLTISNLESNSQILGDAILKLSASEDSSEIEMDFKITNNNKELLNLFGNFSVEDDYYPLDLTLETNNFEINPFSKIGKNVISNFEGVFNSNINISGNTKNPNFFGSIETSNVAFKIPYLNVRYEIENNSTFFLNDQSFFIDDFGLYNTLTGSNGIISGKISHNIFKNWFLELDINSQNLLILNTSSKENDLYYGKGMFNGEAIIYGPTENLLIKLIGSTNKGTSLVIPINDSKNIGNLKFLNFVNPESEENTNQSIKKSLLVDLDLDFNNNANLEVVLDPESQSKIKGVGNGKLNFKINTLGNFNMFGDFQVDKGSYFYRSLGIVNREFELIKGSRITWNGDPYLGDLNINANYEIPGGANPAILIQNTSFNRKIPTIVNINLEGNFNEMKTPSFKINFPNTRGPIKSELDYYLVDDEKRQKQALSLLYQGTFIDEVSLSSVSSQAITNNLYQSASGLIDNIFTNSDDKMNIGINYLKGDKNAASSLLNRDRLGLTLKSEISDKILINGKIGVPVGGVEENVIIGDVQIEFLLNDEGNLKARFFNKENEYQYFGDDIGYTQGMGVSYEIDFNDIKTLFRNKNKKRLNK